MTALDPQDLSRAACAARDAADPLAALREQFELPPGVNYLDGNSLGVLPRATAARVHDVVTREWGQGLIRSWNSAGWIELPRRVGDKIGRLVGAAPGELVVADSTSVNLFKVLSAAARIAQADDAARRVIVSERSNFPTDLYIAESVAAQHGMTLELLDIDAIPARLAPGAGADVAVLMLTQVNYRSGRMADMAAVTALAHDAGALMLWDLAHSAGAVPVDLNGADADFAVGCGYKYLNGGPGAPAFCWAHPRHAERFWQPLSGWMGHAAPFVFEPGYRPAPGIGRYLCGTPQVIGMSALECGVDTVLAAEPLGGMAALRAKSVALSELFIALVRRHLAGSGLTIHTPLDAARRGSQVSLGVPADGSVDGYAVVQALIARGVIGDYRAGDGSAAEPHLLRFGFTPLYTRFQDVFDAVEALAEVLARGEWREERFTRKSAVT
ncbi:kynureninase [Sphaerotilus sulfidivorans]|uniref:Kynureninase n=1 Tax=Sphaerotilus sulfidivorans TaxID=639200 RepID=A0A5C1Q6W9_9BURK|nr:kynureninase [Sphaerotilus sulfidivorans]NZD46149.1 kynureninase [Sphaerotilus sulfidivorans]QEN01892.1 kynureninase [Sphaerotilus sulfidivorans]